MSKISDKIIELEGLIAGGMDIETAAVAAGIPLQWAITWGEEIAGLRKDRFNFEGSEECQD